MDKLSDILIILVLTITFLISVTQKVKATETTNILNNGSFDNQTDGWELDGNVDYDNNTYSGGISKSVRFSSSDGGSISQTINLDNIVSDEKYVSQVHGSILSIGCNNEGDLWCTTTGTANNLDPVNTTITFKTKTQEKTLNYNFTSDYNDGTITSTFTINLDNDFHINETIIDVNVFGADTGNKTGQFGSIIDDLSLSLTLADLVIAQTTEINEITQITAPESIIGGLDSVSIVDTLSSGIIDMQMPDDMQIANLSPQISIISDIRVDQMHSDMADIGINNEMPVLVDTGADVPVDNNMPEIDMPDLTDMPIIEMPDIQMPDNLPEINDIQIESVNEIQNEPETLQEIREEIPENNLEEHPTELENTNMEDDLKENINERSYLYHRQMSLCLYR